MAPSTGNDANTISRTIAIISWTISIPIDIFPYNSSKTHLSLNNLTMIIVLLNANAIATYILVTQSNPRSNAIHIPIAVVKTTCHTQTTSDAFPRSLTTAGFRPNQTINNKNATPICANIWTLSVCWIRLRILGLIKIPETIYPIISGCFNSLINAVTATTKVTTAASSAKACAAKNDCIVDNNSPILNNCQDINNNYSILTFT